MSDRLNQVLKVAEYSVTTTSNGYFQFSMPSGAFPIKAYALNNTNYILHLGYNNQNGSFMGIATANGIDYLVTDTTFSIKVIYAAFN